MKHVFLTLLFVAVPSLVVAGGDPVAGKAASIVCMSCHNSDGNSNNPAYPKLAGQRESYLKKQLLDFKSGARKEGHKSSMVQALSKTDISNLARFYAKQKRNATSGKPGSTAGRAIFEKGVRAKGVAACARCHGRQGQGRGRTPLLAGQHEAYIVKTLKAFRNGTRRNDKRRVMQRITKGLGDEDIAELARYISGL